ncbi:hypothetical protein J132_04693 [Termitomyces sp. J132]|nr:hypothetical protein J132_04693 [Termitomyces sp. J132]
MINFSLLPRAPNSCSSPASPEATPLSANKVAKIRNSNAQLQALITQLISKVNAQPDPLPAIAPPTASESPAMGPFVAPITAVGVNGASIATPLSLCTHFPNVDTSVLIAIITHKFKAADLHKLNPTNCNKETAYMFNGLTNQFKISHHAAKEYKNHFLVLIPLQTYFWILAFHVNNTSAMDTFWVYTKQLLELVAEYEWSTVLAYHLVFFIINALRQWLVTMHNKATNDPCQKFNDGKCTTNPCPWSCSHTCSACGKSDHSRVQHKD